MLTFIAWGFVLVVVLILEAFVKVWDCLWGAGNAVCRCVRHVAVEVVASVKEADDATEDEEVDPCDTQEKQRESRSSGDGVKLD